MKYVKKYGTDKIRVLEFVKNRGKGGAVRMVLTFIKRIIYTHHCPSNLLQGSLSARGERVLFLDADGATKISDMKCLEDALTDIAKDCNVPAIAVGSRAHLQDEAVANVN